MSHEDRSLSLSPTAHSPIFIGGQHRSGTTLMRRLFKRHPHIACGPESNLFRDKELLRIREYLRTEWAPGLDPRYKFDPTMVDRVLAGLIDAVVMPYCRAQHKQRWSEKTPKNIYFIDTLFALGPTLQFIHMIRDPRDVYCWSVRKQRARRPAGHRLRQRSLQGTGAVGSAAVCRGVAVQTATARCAMRSWSPNRRLSCAPF